MDVGNPIKHERRDGWRRDILYPAQSTMYSTDLNSFPQERTLWQIYNKTNDLYTSFKEIYLTLYVEAARRRNKQTSKRMLEPEDIVIILDRITRGSDLALGQVISVDAAQKNVLLRTIQRGARVNNVFKILDPAKHTRLVRSILVHNQYFSDDILRQAFPHGLTCE